MKRLLLLMLLVSSAAQAQVITAKELVIQSKLTFNGYYIYGIQNDTGLSNQSRMVPTSKAVFDFVTGRLAGFTPGVGGADGNNYPDQISLTPSDSFKLRLVGIQQQLALKLPYGDRIKALSDSSLKDGDTVLAIKEHTPLGVDTTGPKDSLFVRVGDGLMYNRSTKAAEVDISQRCSNVLDTLLTQRVLDGRAAMRYLAFPIAEWGWGKTLFLGYLNGDTHGTGGRAEFKTSQDYGETWSSPITVDSVGNARNLITSNIDDTLTQHWWREAGTLHFRKSLDGGKTWSAISTFRPGPGNDTAATENKIKSFKGKWFLPFYSFTPSANTAGVLISTDQGVSWIRAMLPAIPYEINENTLLPESDSLLQFIRGENIVGGETYKRLYRSASADGVNWTTPQPVNLPRNWSGKPEVFKMWDGRYLTHYRAYIAPYGYTGLVAISKDRGFNFDSLYMPEPLGQFMYASIIHMGGDRYQSFNGYDVMDINNATRASIKRELWRVQDCELYVGSKKIKPVSPPAERLSSGTPAPTGNYIENQNTAPQIGNLFLSGEVKSSKGRFGFIPGVSALDNMSLVVGNQLTVTDGSGNTVYLYSVGSNQIFESYHYGTNTASNLLLNPSGGKVGIGTATTTSKLAVGGVVESTSGGFKYPDGTIQTTAATGSGSSPWTTTGVDISNSNTGNVGIGTSTPFFKLDVNGGSRFQGDMQVLGDFKPVTVDASSGLRVTGAFSPTSGVGLELGFGGGTGYIQAYNRSTNQYVPLTFYGTVTMPGLGNTGNRLLGRNSSSHLYEVGIDPASLSRKLATDFTDVGNVGTGEDDLMSYTLPGGTLAQDGDELEVKAFFNTANNANSKTLKFFFGGQSISLTGVPAGSPIEVTVKIVRTSATTQKVFFVSHNFNTSPGMVLNVLPSETLSSNILIKFTGEGVSTDDIIQRTMTVKFN